MLTDLNDRIIFKKASNGGLPLEINGIAACRDQAQQVVSLFIKREQKINNFSLSEERCEIEIYYGPHLPPISRADRKRTARST